MKKMLTWVLAAMMVLPLSGCGPQKYTRYRTSFMGTFDTMVEMIVYVQDESVFDEYASLLKAEFERYNQLFDKYHSYPGINNIKTINDNAGIAPVKVDREIIELLLLAKDWEKKSSGAVNVAYGPVLSIWHDYRERYQGGAPNPQLPPIEELQAAAQNTDIDKVVIDELESTVFLSEKGMELDVGSIAKGYATELVGEALYRSNCRSFILSSGGNVRIYDGPPDGEREKWGVGIQNPDQNPLAPEQTYLDTIFTTNRSVVTSGNYQRFYEVDGKKIHHIIDPKTLMPADRYASVTVVCPTSGVADILSTALYIMDEQSGRELARNNSAEVFWVYPDGTVSCTDGLIPLLKERGGATSLRQTDGK